MTKLESTVSDILKHADVQINGTRPQDITIHDSRVYGRVLRDRELGLGESYMDGWWDAKRPDELIAHILSADLAAKVKPSPALIATGLAQIIGATVNNRQTVTKAKKNASHHYNIGNDLYERMLDQRMIYSCGYWDGVKTLDEAQTNKLDLICRKLQLKKGMTLLDIGCGWGGFAEYAARHYGVTVTGISPASEQVKIAKKRTKGLKVKILQKDYRDMTGQFDRITSIGMLEHVGIKNYGTFFAACKRLLAPGGMMLHHTIGSNQTYNPREAKWIDRYIFPGGEIPTIAQVASAVEKKFVIEDLHNFGPDYDKTLMAWYQNFKRHYPEISDKYDQRFYRMWEFYLLMFAALFRTRNLQLWQFVMRPVERSSTYKSPR
jgi:cyclopropane-fatty-acyl-phospholipid synthase